MIGTFLKREAVDEGRSQTACIHEYKILANPSSIVNGYTPISRDNLREENEFFSGY